MRLLNNVGIMLALLLLLAVMGDIIAWMRISSVTESFNEAKAIYLDRFPGFLRRARIVAAIEIGMLLLSAWLFHAARTNNNIHKLMRCLMVLSLVLAGWLLFSLM